MATKTDLRESQHGEEEERPLFGDQSRLIDPEEADELQSHYDTPGAVPLAKGSGPESPRALLDRENVGGVGSTGKANKKESSVANKLGKGFTPVDAALPPQAKIAKAVLGMFKSRKGQAGIAAGGIVGGLIFIASIGQGPFMLMQLGQLLMKPEFGNEKNSSLHVFRMMRYAKTGDFGETRVGYLRSKLKDKYLAEFEKAGVGFEQTGLGRPSKMTFDTRNPEFEDTKDLTKQEFAGKLNLPADYADEVTISRKGALWVAEFDNATVKGNEYASRALDSTVRKVGLGNVFSGSMGSNLRARVLKKYFGLPGLHSPISKKFSEVAERAVNRQQARAAEKERGSPRAEKIKELSASARQGLRDKMDAKKQAVAGFTLGAAAGACLVHESADDAAEFNHRAIVGASALEAEDKRAVGSQVQSGFDNEGDPLNSKAVGVIQQSLIDDDGKSVFAAKGIDALARNNKDAKGEDLPLVYQQAFSGQTTADNIRDGTDTVALGVDVTGIACGWPGQVAGGAFSIALLLAGPPSGGAAWAVFLGKTSAGIAAGLGAGVLISKLLESDLKVEPPLAGPLGGNLLAYGARASSNMSAIAAGGVQLNEADSTALLKEQEEAESEEFRSKSFFARMFDMRDYRSLASVSLRSYTPGISGSMSNISSLLSSPLDLFSSLAPKAYAQEEVYDWWGQPTFGLPSEVLDDPRLQDPDQNDLEITKILNGSDGGGYVEKAKKCFGAEISKGAQGWHAITIEEAIPTSSEYIKAKCNNIDDVNWRRTMLFVFQTKDASALACFEGLDDEACAEILGSEVASNDAGGGNGEDIGGGFTLQKYSPALDTPGGNIEPKGITLHWWAYDGNGDIKSLANGLKGNKTCGPQGCSVQLGITKEGKIWQMTDSLTKLTYHAAGANATTIGIEIEGTPDQFGREGIEKYPEKFEAVVATVKWLMQEYDIKLDENNKAKCGDAFGVHSHKYYSSCNPGKTDVDDYYLSEVRKRVE